jgi:hypothetical protein
MKYIKEYYEMEEYWLEYCNKISGHGEGEIQYSFGNAYREAIDMLKHKDDTEYPNDKLIYIGINSSSDDSKFGIIYMDEIYYNNYVKNNNELNSQFKKMAKSYMETNQPQIEVYDNQYEMEFNESRSNYLSDKSIKEKIIEILKSHNNQIENNELFKLLNLKNTDEIYSFYETLAELESEGKVKESSDKKSIILV